MEEACPYVGYRFHIGGVRTNLLVGYRGLGIKLEDNDLRLTIQVRGPLIGLAFEF